MRKIALIPSLAEIRGLIVRISIRKPPKLSFILEWSIWRRKHQAKAMLVHYKSRGHLQLQY
jgi:hypothetical protein